MEKTVHSSKLCQVLHQFIVSGSCPRKVAHILRHFFNRHSLKHITTLLEHALNVISQYVIAIHPSQHKY